MAVSSVGSTGSIYGQRNVLSGLASGMDTESMIENMTQATRLKIAQQKQKKELLGWRQSAYQSISSPLIEFSKKYCDYSSSTNLLSSAFFNQSTTTAVGKNNMYISATGKTNSKVEVLGVKQMASAATHTVKGFSDTISGAAGEGFVSGSFGVGTEDKQTVSNLAGGTFTFTYGNKDYSITLDSTEYKTADELAKALNEKLGEVDVSITGGTGTPPKLSEFIQFGTDGKQLTVQATEEAIKTGNTVKLDSVSDNIKKVLGFDPGKDGLDLTTEQKSKAVTETELINKETMTRDVLAGKKIQISLNGETKTITMPELVEKKDQDGNVMKDQNGNVIYEEWTNDSLVTHMQTELDKAFGKDKVEVAKNVGADGKLQLQFTVKDGDAQNVLRINGGDTQALKAMGLEVGDGNRINLNKKLEDFSELTDKDGNLFNEGKLTINGVSIDVKKDMTLRELMSEINANEEMGVKLTYSELSDTMQLSAKETGEGRQIEIGGDLAEKIFGKATKDNNKDGTDAHISVKINGETMELYRPSNEIDVEGLKINISGTFGYEGDKLIEDPTEKVTFDTKPDTDKIVDAIKSMVEDYNKIMDTVYKEMTTKPNRDYQPLTEEQRDEMSEEQIEKWEEKAKEGLLFGDSQLRALQSDLRFIFNPGGAATQKLRAMGIEVSSSLSSAEGGKVKLDEAKLRAAIESDVDSVRDAFNALPQENAGAGEVMNSAHKGGVMTQLKGVLDRYASTSIVSPGILVARAGSPHSANSLLKNALKTEMDSIDDVISRLNSKLSNEIDRYNKQFTQLEMMVSQMNAQSAQLAGLLGG